jgi:hypothetical protein
VIRLLLFLLFIASAVYTQAGATINFVGYRNPSAPIFSKAGSTTVNFQLYAQYTGIHKPGAGIGEGGFSVIAIRSENNDLLYYYAVPVDSIPGAFGGHTRQESQPYLLTTGSFEFSNPSDQNLIIEEQIFHTRPLEGLAGFPAQEWSSAAGQSLVSGGDKPVPPNPTPVPILPPTTRSNIHAVVISGLSDPARIVASANVTVTGGVVALGKDPSPPTKPISQWSSGLRIIPDQSLLTGAKIPPLTPNIIDVRIVSHDVTGNLSSSTP